MNSRIVKRIPLLWAVPLLGLACGVLAMSAAPAGAATAPARMTSTTTHAATPPAAVSGPAHLALNGPASVSVRPHTCTPSDLPWRFSGSTWTTYWLEKTPNGCQSVWATSGQTFNYELIGVNNNEITHGTCNGGSTCQLWDPATNYVPFYVWDSSYTPTSVNIYY